FERALQLVTRHARNRLRRRNVRGRVTTQQVRRQLRRQRFDVDAVGRALALEPAEQLRAERLELRIAGSEVVLDLEARRIDRAFLARDVLDERRIETQQDHHVLARVLPTLRLADRRDDHVARTDVAAARLSRTLLQQVYGTGYVNGNHVLGKLADGIDIAE